MKNQYEQQCNAAFLSKMGVLVLPKLKNQISPLSKWLANQDKVHIKYHHYVSEILGMIILKELHESSGSVEIKDKINYSEDLTVVGTESGIA